MQRCTLDREKVCRSGHIRRREDFTRLDAFVFVSMVGFPEQPFNLTDLEGEKMKTDTATHMPEGN